MISEFFFLALKSLKKRKLRVGLTIIGIVLSIATIFMLISLSLGLQSAVEEQFRSLGTDKFFILPKGQIAGPGTESATTLTIKDAEAIEKVQGVSRVSYLTVATAKVEYNSKVRYFSVVGIPLDRKDLFFENTAFKPEEGRLLKKGDKQDASLGYQFNHNNLFGKNVKINDEILINEKQFKVRTFSESQGNPNDDQIIIIPFEEFRNIFNTSEKVDEILVQVNLESDINEVAERTEKALQRYRGVDEKTKDFTILTPEELLSTFGSILQIITSFLLGVAAISLLVGGIGIANTMFTSVLERTREIGTMKAIGAKNSNILSIFLIESGMIGLVGGIIGVLLGFGAGKLIEFIAVNSLGTTLLQISSPPYLVLGCLAFGFLAGALSGILPAYRASKLRTVDALRYE